MIEIGPNLASAIVGLGAIGFMAVFFWRVLR